uniref:cAMP-response element binding protein 2 n=1 Tax=Onchidium reevesii TaxID=2547651 RepID=A0A482CQC2_9EUPU|nr:cAMP-response element binding protein 2 [Onchidium reevesii]
MELDQWTEESFTTPDWGLDPLSYHSDGLFDDLKLEGCLKHDSLLNTGPQDVVEHVLSDASRDEDILGAEWMESSDLGPYLDILDNGQDKLLSLDVGIFDYSSAVVPTEVPTQALEVVNDPLSLPTNGLSHNLLTESMNRSANNAGISSSLVAEAFESVLSPPRSPEQALYLEEIESGDVTDSRKLNKLLKVCNRDPSVNLFEDHAFDSVLNSESLLLNSDSGKPLGAFDSMGEIMGSPLSADDVESMLSCSSPSPSNLSCGSLIDSSPELYKVITSSSAISNRHSHQIHNSSKERKSAAKRKAVPECVEHLNKKERKKMQNKNAAIRYRMKKKEEAAGIKSEEQELEELNEALKIKVDDLQREIKYMKNLMEDICKAKGVAHFLV